MEVWTIMAALAAALGSIAIIITYGLFFRRLLVGETEARGGLDKAKGLFYEELERRFELGVIATADNIALVQRSIAAQEKSQSFAEEELAALLEGYLLKVTEKDRFQSIQSLLDTERKEKPFSVLPDKERVIADRLKKAIELTQTDFAINQLNELVTSLGTKFQASQEELSSSRTWSRLGVYGTIAGLILTIVVGLLVGFLT